MALARSVGVSEARTRRPVFPGLDDFPRAAGVGGDDWLGACHGFEEDEAEGFGEGGEDEEVGGGHESVRRKCRGSPGG